MCEKPRPPPPSPLTMTRGGEEEGKRPHLRGGRHLTLETVPDRARGTLPETGGSSPALPSWAPGRDSAISPRPVPSRRVPVAGEGGRRKGRVVRRGREVGGERSSRRTRWPLPEWQRGGGGRWRRCPGARVYYWRSSSSRALWQPRCAGAEGAGGRCRKPGPRGECAASAAGCGEQ